MSTIDAENTMRALQERDLLRSQEEMVDKFKHYVATYEPYLSQSPDQFINDMLYGIGRSMCNEYEFAVGFLKFQDRLKQQIDGQLEDGKPAERPLTSA